MRQLAATCLRGGKYHQFSSRGELQFRYVSSKERSVVIWYHFLNLKKKNETRL